MTDPITLLLVAVALGLLVALLPLPSPLGAVITVAAVILAIVGLIGIVRGRAN